MNIFLEQIKLVDEQAPSLFRLRFRSISWFLQRLIKWGTLKLVTLIKLFLVSFVPELLDQHLGVVSKITRNIIDEAV